MFWWFSKTAEFFTGCFQDSLVDKYHGVISLSQDDALQPNIVCQICLTLCNSLAARQSSSGEPERKVCDCGRWIWHLEVVSWGKMKSLLSPLFGCPGAEGAFYYSLRDLDILQNLTSPFVVGKFSIYSVLRRELISYWYHLVSIFLIECVAKELPAKSFPTHDRAIYHQCFWQNALFQYQSVDVHKLSVDSLYSCGFVPK